MKPNIPRGTFPSKYLLQLSFQTLRLLDHTFCRHRSTSWRISWCLVSLAFGFNADWHSNSSGGLVTTYCQQIHYLREMRNDIRQRSDITSESYSAVNCLPEHNVFLLSFLLKRSFQRAGQLLWYVWDLLTRSWELWRTISANCISLCHINTTNLKLSSQIKSLLQTLLSAQVSLF